MKAKGCVMYLCPEFAADTSYSESRKSHPTNISLRGEERVVSNRRGDGASSPLILDPVVTPDFEPTDSSDISEAGSSSCTKLVVEPAAATNGTATTTWPIQNSVSLSSSPSSMSDVALDTKVPVTSLDQSPLQASLSRPLRRKNNNRPDENSRNGRNGQNKKTLAFQQQQQQQQQRDDSTKRIEKAMNPPKATATPPKVQPIGPALKTIPQLCAQATEALNRQSSNLSTTESPSRRKPLLDIVRPYVFPMREVSSEIQSNKNLLLRHMTLASTSGRLTLMNLSRRGLSADDAGAIKQAIIQNPSLSVLKLSYNSLGDAGVTIISTGINQNGSLHANLSILDVGFNDIGDAGCAALALNALAGNDALKTLYLSGNRIKQKGAMAIAGAILHGCSLRDIHLSVNTIGSIGVQALARAVAEREAMKCAVASDVEGNLVLDPSAGNPNLQTVEELHFGGTEMGQAGFVTIPSMILTNFSMRVLCLSNNDLTDNEVALLAQSFTRNKRIPLEVLNLSHNEISDVGVEYLMNALWGSSTLREMRFDNNKIRDRGAQLFAVVLTSINLEVIDLSCNRVTSAGMKALMKALSENNSLQQLGLCGIPVDPTSAKALSYGIAYNTSLQYLYIDDCNVGYSAQRHVVAGVVSNRNASLRVFTGFPIGAIVVTLGLPKPMEGWTNDQVLGFVRMMWKLWRKEKGNVHEAGPAAPKTVVAASKRAMAVLGMDNAAALNTEPHERLLKHTSPLAQTNASLLERTMSGTLRIPPIVQGLKGAGRGSSSRLSEAWTEEGELESIPTRPQPVSGPRVDPVRREKNLKWLRSHFRSLHEIGRLPFNQSEMWQLHQYFFSPISATLAEVGESDFEGNNVIVEGGPLGQPNSLVANSQPPIAMPSCVKKVLPPSPIAAITATVPVHPDQVKMPPPPQPPVNANSVNAAQALIERIRAQQQIRSQAQPPVCAADPTTAFQQQSLPVQRMLAAVAATKPTEATQLPFQQPTFPRQQFLPSSQRSAAAPARRRPLPADAPQKAKLGRKISYQMLSQAAIAANTLERAKVAAALLSDSAVAQAKKRHGLSRRRSFAIMDDTSDDEDDDDSFTSSSSSEEIEPASKRARNHRPRIAFYPRIRMKLEEYGSKPSQHETLSLLRQLKFVENELFKGHDVYTDPDAIRDPEQSMPSDVEMIILDLL